MPHITGIDKSGHQIGEIFPIGYGAVVPPGTLLCNGASVLQSAYPQLFVAIGATWGAVDSTHFSLPDLRGKFLRGQDGGAGNDPDRASRTSQPGTTLSLTGATTSGLNTITGLSSTAQIAYGASVSGTGIPASTYVNAILSSTSVQISANATATASGVSLTFSNGAVGDHVGSVQADQFYTHGHGVNDPGHSHSINASDSPNESPPRVSVGMTNTDYTCSTNGSGTGISIQNNGGNESRPKNANAQYVIAYI